MTQIKEVMTKNVHCVKRETTLKDTAETMRTMDVGFVPVTEDGTNEGKLLGIITDRDITIRAVAEGMDPNQTRAEKVMSKNVTYCYEDETLDDLSAALKEEKIRRAIVLDRNEKLTGVCSLGDLARTHDDLEQSGDVLRRVSEPGKK